MGTLNVAANPMSFHSEPNEGMRKRVRSTAESVSPKTVGTAISAGLSIEAFWALIGKELLI